MEMLPYRVELAARVEPAFIGKRVLIAEDEILIALDLEDMLVRMGFTIAGLARDVASTLDLLHTTPIDVAVLDFQLGRDTVHPVTEALAGASIPFVLATGFKPDRSYPEAPLLQKPYSFDEIKECMVQLLAAPADQHALKTGMLCQTE